MFWVPAQGLKTGGEGGQGCRLVPWAASRLMDRVDPGDVFGLLDRRDIEIDHHGLIIRADTTHSSGSSALALISWWGTKGGT